MKTIRTFEFGKDFDAWAWWWERFDKGWDPIVKFQDKEPPPMAEGCGCWVRVKLVTMDFADKVCEYLSFEPTNDNSMMSLPRYAVVEAIKEALE